MSGLKKIFFLGIAYLLSLFTLIGQDTYIKSFRLYEESIQENGTTIMAKDGHIYIGVGSVCDNKICAKYAKLNFTGEIEWKTKHLWTDNGNRNAILYHNGELLLSTHERWSSPSVSFHLTKVNKDTGDSLAHYTYNYDSLSTEGIASEGILLYKNQYLLYGEAREKKDGIPTGFIQWINLDGKPIKLTKYRLPDNALVINRLEDLQSDSTGHLVFITTYKKDNKEYHVIRKLDSLGNVVKDLLIYANRSLQEIPKMAVDINGNYIIAHRKKNEDLVSFKQILCVDTSGNYLWYYDLSDRISGNQYDINKVKATKDGGAVVSGNIYGKDFQNLLHRDAFVIKLDKTGKKEWEKRINFYDQKDTLLDFCSFLDVVPLDSGGYAAVGYHIYSDLPRITDLLLVQLDKNGCVAGYDCGVDTMIVRSPLISVSDVNEGNKQWTVYPNPASHTIIINQGQITDMTYQLISTSGQPTKTLQIADAHHNVVWDISEVASGTYVLTMMQGGKVIDTKQVVVVK